jgi:glycosyltransferase involved in cell wall biosynthesis
MDSGDASGLRAAGLRVAVGPADPAGCASALVQGLRELGVDAELALTFATRYGEPVLTRSERLRYALKAPLRRDVFHLQSWTWLPHALDLRLARAARRTAVVTLHGDDCRLYGLTRALFAPQALARSEAADVAARARLRRLAGLTDAAIVKDLELAAYAYPFFERVYVVPPPVRRELLERDGSTGPAERPIVLHAPSDPRSKGTEAIERAVADVATHVPLEFRLVTGVSHAELREELRRATIVVDQLDAAGTGVLALEAMAVGKPVLAEYDPAVLAPFQADAPIVRVRAETLARELTELMSDRERRERLGRLGRVYVLRTHAPVRVAEATVRIYLEARHASPGLFQATAVGIAPLERGRARLDAAERARVEAR